jgi:ATP-binding cassette subfamily F protein 3
MISVNSLSIHFTGDYIFDDVSFKVNDRDRIGLVGKNGAGKTTLLRIIAGLQEPESGNIVKTTGSTIGYLQQELIINSSNNVSDEARLAFREVNELKEKIQKITEQLSERTDYHTEGYSKLIEKLNHCNERFNILDGNSVEADLEKVLLGLGFEKDDFLRSMGEFSGGWQMRVELAKILLSKPDVVLLDEPTNHLDIESIQWLEDFLINYKGAVVLVSHDRAFLDNVTDRTIEISLGKIYDYKACYSEYVLMREERLETQIAAFNNQQRQIEQIERFINRFRYKSTKSRQVQSRVKMLDKIDKIEIDESDNSSIQFVFPKAPSSGKVVIEAKKAGKSYGEKLVLSDLEFAITKDEKVAFVGRNGEGKTTLSKMIVGDIDFSGKLMHGHNVKIGYYAQNQAELLDMDRTVFQTIDDIAVGDMRTKVRAILGSFLFGGETIDKKVKVLSGGEKSRLALAKLLLTPVNLLILDEPTNHLDMQSKDILKNALLKYDGALIIVSHDRDFLQGLTSKVFEFKNHNIKQYIGDIYDFLDSRKLESLKELELNRRNKNMGRSSEDISENKVNWERKKEIDRECRKLNTQISKTEIEISDLEKEISSIDAILAEPEKHTEIDYNEVYTKYGQLKQKHSEVMSKWEDYNIKLEEYKTQN